MGLKFNPTTQKLDLVSSGGSSNTDDGTTAGQMAFWDGSKGTYTETSELFWDDVNKRLGIGTDSPDTILTLAQTTDNKGLKIYGYDDRSTNYGEFYISSSGYAVFNADKGYSFMEDGVPLVGVDSGTYFMFDDVRQAFGDSLDYSMRYNSASTNWDFISGGNIKMVMNTAGDVGIGTSSPEASLHIAGGAGKDLLFDNGADLRWKDNAGNDRRVFFVDSINDVTFGATGLNSMRFDVGGVGDALFIQTTTGNVGIGIASPTRELNVKQSADTSSNGIELTALSGDKLITYINSIGTGVIQSDNGFLFNNLLSNLVFRSKLDAVWQDVNGANEWMRIKGTTGNVGIGTDSPNNKLQIAGLINFDDNLSNVALGTDALDRVTTGEYNVALGFGAGEYISTGHSNMAIGRSSLGGTTIGTFNTGVGYQTAIGNTEGEKNTAIGSRALRYNQVGDSNIAIGYLAMEGYSGNSYSDNVGIGTYAGREITTGYSNTFIGGYSLGTIKSGSNNVAIGYRAGRSLTTGSSNIFIGLQSGYTQTTNSNLLIVDNQLRADQATELSNSILYGVMASTPASQTLRINAQVGINLTPTAYLTLPAGTATVNTAPLKFTAGVLNTTPEAGAIESDGDKLYFTQADGIRKEIAFV